MKKLRSLHCVEATQVELRVRSNVDRLDNTLSRTRAKKWARDGIAPRPLRIFLKRRGKRGGKRHARYKTPPHEWQERQGNRRKTQQEQTLPEPKESESSDPDRTLSSPSTVVNLTTADLSPSEQSLLRKGLSFCPSTERLSLHRLSLDLDDFIAEYVCGIISLIIHHRTNRRHLRSAPPICVDRPIGDLPSLLFPRQWRRSSTLFTLEFAVLWEQRTGRHLTTFHQRSDGHSFLWGIGRTLW